MIDVYYIDTTSHGFGRSWVHELVYIAFLVAAEVAWGSPDRQAESPAAWL